MVEVQYNVEIPYDEYPYCFCLLKEDFSIIQTAPVIDQFGDQFGDRIKIKGWYVFFKYEEDFMMARLKYG